MYFDGAHNHARGTYTGEKNTTDDGKSAQFVKIQPTMKKFKNKLDKTIVEALYRVKFRHFRHFPMFRKKNKYLVVAKTKRKQGKKVTINELRAVPRVNSKKKINRL